MERIQELFVVVENRPGALGELLGVLAKEKINIEAIGLFQDIAKLSVSDAGRARKALMKNYQVETRDVLRLYLDNKPGAFAFIASRLGTAGLNIDYCYATVSKEGTKAAVIVDVADLDKALEVLKDAE
ncbi:MAG TPA: ACT domain-containing protein [Bacteroidota bacterium]